MCRKSLNISFIVVILILCVGLLATQGPIGKSIEPVNVSGKVIDSHGNAVANAKVYAYAQFYKAYEDTIIRETASAEDGSFSFKGLVSPPTRPRHSHYVFIATYPAFAIGWERQTKKMDLTNIEISLETPDSISGRVVDKEGRPVEGVLVKARLISFDTSFPYWGRLYIPDWVNLTSSLTDKGGRFTITNLPQLARVLLAIIHDEYDGGDLKRQGRIDVGTQDLELTLRPGAVIQGRVSFQETGKPADRIRVFCQGIHPMLGYDQTKTDLNGKYALKSLPAGSYNVCVDFPDEEPGWTAVAQEAVEVSEGSIVKDIDLYLIKGGFITGRVTDAESEKPIPDVGIGFYGPARPQSSGAIQSVYTGKDGRYRFRAPPGRTRVYVCGTPEKYPYPKYPKEWRYVEVESGKTTSEVDFKLNPGVTVVGNVIGPDGNPMSGVPVFDIHILSGKTTESGENGKFALQGLEPGTIVTIQAYQKELVLGASAGVEVKEPPGEELTLKLQKCAMITGCVLDEENNPIKGAGIYLVITCRGEPTMSRRTITTDASGHYKIRNVIPGTVYRVEAIVAGFSVNMTKEFTTIPGETYVVSNLVLKKAKDYVSGRVVDTKGNPVVRARVYIDMGLTVGFGETYTDSEGNWRLEGLVADRVSIWVSHKEYEPKLVSGILTGTSDITIVLKKRKTDCDE